MNNILFLFLYFKCYFCTSDITASHTQSFCNVIWRAKVTYIVHAEKIFETENIDLHLLKAWRSWQFKQFQNTAPQALIDGANI